MSTSLASLGLNKKIKRVKPSISNSCPIVNSSDNDDFKREIIGSGGFCKVYDNFDGTVSKKLYRKLSEEDLNIFLEQKELAEKRFDDLDIPYKEFEVKFDLVGNENKYEVVLLQERINPEQFLINLNGGTNWFKVIETFHNYLKRLKKQETPIVGIDFRAENFALEGEDLVLVDNYAPIIIDDSSISIFSRSGRLDIPLNILTRRYVKKYYEERALLFFVEYFHQKNPKLSNEMEEILKKFEVDVSIMEKLINRLSWRLFCIDREIASKKKEKEE